MQEITHNSPKNIAQPSSGLMIRLISPSQIQAGRAQPRVSFDQTQLENLATSIKNYGILQPILVRELSADKFEIIAGERRWRASKLAGLEEIPCIVKTEVNGKQLDLALIENLQREQLSPIEEASAFQLLMDHHNYTHEELSKQIGTPRATISNTIRLLQLPDSVQNAIHVGKISTGHGKVLLTLSNGKDILKLAEMIVSKSLSVRKTEEIARSMTESSAPSEKTNAPLSSNLRYICDQFKGHLGTKVKISGDEERGKIEISYYNQEDLTRISDLVLGDDFE